ncbi:Ppx/GppA phosphatase family protein [Synechococcus elongatus]|uniref:Ppx/GppA phosphatase family protein n=1 Tax=Synechococcus elongatus PCC 11802 TaxID=2283154 RepID=A0AAT9JP08_SYNEL
MSTEIVPHTQPSLPSELGSEPILAAIDVGTNSIHMVVVRIRPDLPAFDIIGTEKATVRLGDRDPATGELTEAAMERALQALQRCQAIAAARGATQIVAVATSAVREAPNGRQFLDRVIHEVGLEVDLISGPEEARRIYLGVLSGMDFQQRHHAIIDIGGGSTELILGAGQEPLCLTSTKVGAVRLTQEFIHTDPISPSEYTVLQAYVRGMVERAVDEVKAALPPNTPLRLIGTSGTIQALAALHAHQSQGGLPTTFNGYSLALSDLQQLVQQLRRMPFAERQTLPELSERRAEIIVAGAIVLQETMQMLGCDRITICERALREGLIVNWMLSHGLIEDKLRYQGSVRQRSVYNQARKFRVDVSHGEQVARLALSLFDQLQGYLHQWGEGERQLLWAAAILHNCGHHIDHSSHHKHSYYLIRHGGLLGYNETEIELIANLARYHRKSLPKKKHENFRTLPTKEQRRLVEQLSAILRAAVALDRRQVGAIASLHCRYLAPQRQLLLQLHPARSGEDCALELWSFDYNRHALEAAFAINVAAELVPQPLSTV